MLSMILWQGFSHVYSSLWKVCLFSLLSCLPLFQEGTTHTAMFMHKAMCIINSAVSNADCWRGMKLTTPKKTFFSKL